MSDRRYRRYSRHWPRLIEVHGSLCFYCELEPAACIDHIIPVTFGGGNDFDNLVPSCFTCNLIANNKVFEDVWQKKQHILSRRKKKLTHAICTGCLLPFEYRYHSPSLFLCCECYDIEYKTRTQFKKKWTKWLSQLEEAGFFVEAHRLARPEIAALNAYRISDKRRHSYMILRKHLALMGAYDE